jgi:hypothetical protein
MYKYLSFLPLNSILLQWDKTLCRICMLFLLLQLQKEQEIPSLELKMRRNYDFTQLYFQVLNFLPSVIVFLCLNEYHMKTPEILQVNLENYTLGASYCRQNMARGVSIFVKKNLKFNTYIHT